MIFYYELFFELFFLFYKQGSTKLFNFSLAIHFKAIFKELCHHRLLILKCSNFISCQNYKLSNIAFTKNFI